MTKENWSNITQIDYISTPIKHKIGEHVGYEVVFHVTIHKDQSLTFARISNALRYHFKNYLTHDGGQGNQRDCITVYFRGYCLQSSINVFTPDLINQIQNTLQDSINNFKLHGILIIPRPESYIIEILKKEGRYED